MFENERCGVTGKARFANRKVAKKELARLRKAGKSNCTHVHPCVFCDGYHHTKNERHGRKGRA